MTKARGDGQGTVWYDEKLDKWRWQITLQMTADGKRRTRQGRAATKTAAQKAMSEANTDQARGVLASPETITLRDYTDRWLARQKQLRPRSVALYRQELAYVLNVIGGKRVRDVRPSHVKDLMADLSERKMGSGHGKGQPMSPRTLNKIRTRLRCIFREAVSDEIIRASPMEGVKQVRLSRKPNETAGHALSPDQDAHFRELGILLYAAGMCRLWPALFTALRAGLRRGEVMGLTWADIDLDLGTIHVRRQLTGHKGGAKLSELLKTDHALRDVYIRPDLIETLRGHRAVLATERENLGLPWRDDGPAFPTATGEFTHPDNLNRALSVLLSWSQPGAGRAGKGRGGAGAKLVARIRAVSAKRAPLPPISPHDLHHTYATLELRNGTPVELVSKSLGHANVSITMDFYRHVSDDERKAYAAKVYTILTEPRPKTTASLPN